MCFESLATFQTRLSSDLRRPETMYICAAQMRDSLPDVDPGSRKLCGSFRGSASRPEVVDCTSPAREELAEELIALPPEAHT